jgi:hypothetical protein
MNWQHTSQQGNRPGRLQSGPVLFSKATQCAAVILFNGRSRIEHDSFEHNDSTGLEMGAWQLASTHEWLSWRNQP